MGDYRAGLTAQRYVRGGGPARGHRAHGFRRDRNRLGRHRDPRLRRRDPRRHRRPACARSRWRVARRWPMARCWAWISRKFRGRWLRRSGRSNRCSPASSASSRCIRTRCGGIISPALTARPPRTNDRQSQSERVFVRNGDHHRITLRDRGRPCGQASAQGLSLQQYLRHLLAEQLPRSEPTTPRERAAFWRQAVAGLPRTPPLSDQAISRDTLYDMRG